MTTLLAHDVTGPADAPAVLLLHAGVADRRMWHVMAGALGTDHRVIAVDLRAFGQSTVPPGVTTWDDVADVLAVLDHVDVMRVAIVGASLGGRVALEVAAAAPARVDRLLLLCPAAGGVEPGPEVRAFGRAEDTLIEAGDVEGATALNVRTWLGPDADDATRATLTTWQRETFVAQLPLGQDVGSPQPDVDLAALTVPTVVVTGAHDPLASVGEHVARTVPGAVMHPLAWAGHLPTLERPSEAAALVRRLLDGP